MHHNFLLQIEGTKEVMIGSFSDPSIGEGEIDRYFDQHNNNSRILPDVVSTFLLGPRRRCLHPAVRVPLGPRWL